MFATALLAAPAAALAHDKPHDDSAAPHRAATTSQVSCSILTPGIAPGTIQTTGRFVATPSGNGVLICHARLPQPPGRAIVLKGLACPTPLGTTTRSHTVITPSGNVTLVCHVKRERSERHAGRIKPKKHHGRHGHGKQGDDAKAEST